MITQCYFTLSNATPKDRLISPVMDGLVFIRGIGKCRHKTPLSHLFTSRFTGLGPLSYPYKKSDRVVTN